MKIRLHYQNPTAKFCEVEVYINDEEVGTLTLHQRDLVTFQMVLDHGLSMKDDSFHSTGNPDAEAGQ